MPESSDQLPSEVLEELRAIRAQLEVITGALQAVIMETHGGEFAVATVPSGIDEIPG